MPMEMKADLNDVFINKYEVRRVFQGEETWTLHENYVVDMKYHCPIGEGDRHFVDIYFDGGYVARCFNPDYIEFQHQVEE